MKKLYKEIVNNLTEGTKNGKIKWTKDTDVDTWDCKYKSFRFSNKGMKFIIGASWTFQANENIWYSLNTDDGISLSLSLGAFEIDLSSYIRDGLSNLYKIVLDKVCPGYTPTNDFKSKIEIVNDNLLKLVK